MKERVIMYGAGGTGRKLLPDIKERYTVVCFVDSDERKWGECIDNIEIKNPDTALRELEYDYIIISSAPGLDTIHIKLSKLGILNEKIIDTYVLLPLESRRQFLENLAIIFDNEQIDGACAEAGVFEGDFAKYINQYFANRKLYLFDTFEGFSEKDIEYEKSKNTSNARGKDYSNTSIELVKAKMPNVDQIIIKKGYFPDSAKEIDENFCFVNLDLDLYQPTKEGLEWFSDKMVTNGVILVHDYFCETFKGPKLAVDEFLKNRKDLRKYPIGDGISVMIVGF